MRRSPPGSCWGLRYSAKFRFRSAVTFQLCSRKGARILLRYSPRLRCGRHARRGNRIESSFGEGMAAQQSRRRQQASAHDAMHFDGFHRILRARGDKTAGARQHRRDQPLIAPQCELHHLLHFRSPTRARCSASRRPRATSSSSSANGRLSTLFRGLNTTSTGPVQACAEWRTASRTRRRMRLRSTDPPSTLPTVKPTRGPPDTASSAGAPRRRKNTVMLPVNCRRPFL